MRPGTVQNGILPAAARGGPSRPAKAWATAWAARRNEEHTMAKRIVVIGAGFGGLSAAALLSREGHEVTVVEQIDHAGGRATVWERDGFRYDLGPSWYLMPDVFDRFFHELGTSSAEQLQLVRLSPGYRIFFGPDDVVDVPADIQATVALFDSFEPGGGGKLLRYLSVAAEQYRTAMSEVIYRDFSRPTDFLSRRLLAAGRKLNVFQKLDDYVRSYFESERARKVLEYTLVFLGGSPNNTPALYSMLSHVDMSLGVWYPLGGIGAIVSAIERLAEQAGARFVFDTAVRAIRAGNGQVTGVVTDDGEIAADWVIANADYHHVETDLLEPPHRQYSERYWETRVVAPSAFILYLGIQGRLERLVHHNLILEHDWMEHFNSMFLRPDWPERPSYYVCCPSRTDPVMAPADCENLFVLMPVAAGLDDNDAVRERYTAKALETLERHVGEPLGDRILVQRVFSHRDFRNRYHAFKGTAVGLAHTMRQTAAFRPRRVSNRVKGLYFTGQYCHPGIGVPMTLISSQILAEKLRR